ncbi:type II toxin-antitoxin system HicA family toxin [Patescibacteria group bacterium]|nr:type II toxin-antitoxin system HicA family toxin [Patescibacteria group bacterium]MBU4347097.1 type II toxin-antitoxin system HicA family toxin [Patescibacteria group bacterium]MBU4455688.1 type II toxin-antitoxin system HicA family toxin [Patescibacteria group bacterium]MCG2691030.1 type II toxin-antitoxin system HicA family toxin [Candidatus Parcubacteria bacterium]
MPKPIGLKHVLKVLLEKGFVFISQKGSHAKYRKIGSPTRNVIIKMGKKEIPHGTFKSILLHSGIEEDDFKKK